MLNRAGLDGFVGQHEVEIGPPYDRTVPDFAYVDAEGRGLPRRPLEGLHGNAERQRADAIIRDQLEDLGLEGRRDRGESSRRPGAARSGFQRVARALKRKDVAAEITADGSLVPRRALSSRDLREWRR